MINAKDLQQAAFQMALAANAFEGSGGGSGMAPAFLLGDHFTGTINQLFTGIGFPNAVDITNSAMAFQLSRASQVLLWSQVDFANNAGNTDYVYAYLDVDGVQAGHHVFVGTAFLAVCQTIVAHVTCGPGTHTVKLRAYVGAAGNTGILYGADVFAAQLGF